MPGGAVGQGALRRRQGNDGSAGYAGTGYEKPCAHRGHRVSTIHDGGTHPEVRLEREPLVLVVMGCLIRLGGNPVWVAGAGEGNSVSARYPEYVGKGSNGKVHLDGGHQVLHDVVANRSV